MRVLLTGGTGFLGRHVRRGLSRGGHDVHVLSRHAPDPALRIDLADPGWSGLPGGYDLVVHAAGKAHSVPRTAGEAADFFRVNLRGTRRLLEELEGTGEPGSLVFVSSSSVYGREEGRGLTEDAPLLAEDPYGRSKAEAEAVVREWGEARGVTVGILRLPLVIGPDAPGNLEKMIGAIRGKRYAGIGDSSARRSMVLVDDVADVIPTVARTGGTYNLTDGYHPSFREMEEAIAGALGVAPPVRIPLPVARAGGMVGDWIGRLTGKRVPLDRRTVSKMTSTLTLDDARARTHLGWTPRPVLSCPGEWVT